MKRLAAWWHTEGTTLDQLEPIVEDGQAVLRGDEYTRLADPLGAASSPERQEPLDLLAELDAWARHHDALSRGIGTVDDVLGFIVWARGALAHPEQPKEAQP